MNANNVNVVIYDRSNNQLRDFAHWSRRIEGLQFATGYPGGLYLDASFYVPRDISQWWELNGAYRVQILNGLKIVYEGYISAFEYSDSASGQGVLVQCIGAWSKIAMNRRWLKYWSDIRTDEQTWRMYDLNNIAHRYDLWQVDRSYGIDIAASQQDYVYPATGQYCRLSYRAPGDQLIERISYNYIFADTEGGWAMRVMYYSTSASAWQDVTGSTIAASGSGAHDLAIDIPSSQVGVILDPTTDITHDSNEQVIATWFSLCVYSATGTIDLPQVAKDIIAEFTDINQTTDYIQSLASPRSLCGSADSPAGFYSENETIADILTRAASFGDGNNDRYAVGFRASDLAASADGKPVLFVEPYPDLSSYDFAIALDDRELTGDVVIRKDFDQIYNYVTVRYQDFFGKTRYITPENDANLKDTTSITAYGQHDYMLDIGYSDSDEAPYIGYRFLAAYKDPQWELSQSVTVVERIRTASGVFAPVSHVTAGKRLKILNWLSDATGTGEGMTFLISATRYDDQADAVDITVGPPPDLIIPTNLPPMETPKFDREVMERAIRRQETPPTRDGGSPSQRDAGGNNDKPKPKTKEEKRLWEQGKWPP